MKAMKAKAFVKKFGWGEARAFVNKTIELYGAVSGLHYASNGYISVLVPHLVRDFDVSISDLKLLVESLELVQFYGGLEGAKEVVSISFASGYGPSSLSDITEAIANVESCQ